MEGDISRGVQLIAAFPCSRTLRSLVNMRPLDGSLRGPPHGRDLRTKIHHSALPSLTPEIQCKPYTGLGFFDENLSRSGPAVNDNFHPVPGDPFAQEILWDSFGLVRYDLGLDAYYQLRVSTPSSLSSFRPPSPLQAQASSWKTRVFIRDAGAARRCPALHSRLLPPSRPAITTNTRSAHLYAISARQITHTFCLFSLPTRPRELATPSPHSLRPSIIDARVPRPQTSSPSRAWRASVDLYPPS